MNHATANERLLELEYGELAPREARAVEAHLESCADCREELSRIREARALMSGLPVDPPPEGGEAIVLAAAREAAAARRPRPWLPRWLWAGTAGAVAAGVLAVVSWQLVRTVPGSALRTRDDDLVGRTVPRPATPAERAEGAFVPPPPAAPAPARVAPEPEPSRPRLAERSRKEAPSAPKRAAQATAPSSAPPGSPREAEPVHRWSPVLEDRAADAVASSQVSGGAGAASVGRAAPPPAPAPAPALARREVASPRVEDSAEEAEAAPFAAAAPPVAERAAAPMRKGIAAEERKPAPSGLSASAPRGSSETRTFPGCPGERRRVVERDEEGRIVRYLRVGEDRSLEHRFGADGRLVSAFAIEGGRRRALPLDAPGLVRSARDAAIDAPPRCEP